MRKIPFLILLCIVLSGCFPDMKVAKIDPASGLISPRATKITAPTITTNVKIPLEKYKEMVFFSSNPYRYDFGFNQLKEIGYFNQVMKYSDLETLVIANNLQDKIISLDSQIGMSRLAHYYKPFLWIDLSSSNETGEIIAKIQVKNAENAQVVFEATTPLKMGSSDDTVWYPLFNALITWINQNR